MPDLAELVRIVGPTDDVPAAYAAATVVVSAAVQEEGLQRALLEGGDYIGVEITGVQAQYPGWSRPASFVFRRTASGWTLVGAERS